MKPLVAFLIDDDADDRMFFEMAVSDLNFPVEFHFAIDGIQGLAMLKNVSLEPDFIFVDINMPKMNGLECLEEIRKIDQLSQVPVYLYSTSNDKKMAEKCIALGGCGLIKKENSLEAMKKRFQLIFEKHLPDKS
jgi:CheY-like chemotaxis protein